MLDTAPKLMLHETAQSLSGVDALLAHCNKLGLDPRKLAQEAELDADRVETQASYLRRSECLRLWEAAQRLARDPLLHLHVVEHAPVGSYPYVERAFANAPSLEEALRLECQLLATLDPGVGLRLEAGGQESGLMLPSQVRIEPPRRWEIEHLFAVYAVLARQLVAPSLVPQRVQLSAKAPRDFREVERVFGCRVDYGCADDRLLFRRADLQLAGPSPCAEVFGWLKEEMDALEHASKTVLLPQQVRKLVRHRLAHGPSISQVAKKLALSQRTLQRRLSEHETTFSDLVLEVRQHYAREWLGERRKSMLEIAEKLGYSDSSAFSRAFKRWTGLCPIQFRQRGTASEQETPPIDPATQPASPLSDRDICQVIPLRFQDNRPLVPSAWLPELKCAATGAAQP